MYVIFSATQNTPGIFTIIEKKKEKLGTEEGYGLFSGTDILTNKHGEPPGFFLPLNSHKVNRDSSEHDDHSKATNHRLRVQTEAQQHSPENQVGDRHQQADLHRAETGLDLIILTIHFKLIYWKKQPFFSAA